MHNHTRSVPTRCIISRASFLCKVWRVVAPYRGSMRHFNKKMSIMHRPLWRFATASQFQLSFFTKILILKRSFRPSLSSLYIWNFFNTKVTNFILIFIPKIVCFALMRIRECGDEVSDCLRSRGVVGVEIDIFHEKKEHTRVSSLLFWFYFSFMISILYGNMSLKVMSG